MRATVEEGLGRYEAKTVASGSYASSREVCAFLIGGDAIDCNAVDHQFNLNRRNAAGTKGPAGQSFSFPLVKPSLNRSRFCIDIDLRMEGLWVRSLLIKQLNAASLQQERSSDHTDVDAVHCAVAATVRQGNSESITPVANSGRTHVFAEFVGERLSNRDAVNYEFDGQPLFWLRGLHCPANGEAGFAPIDLSCDATFRCGGNEGPLFSRSIHALSLTCRS